MKNKIRKALRNCLFAYHQRKHERFYHQVMKMNGIKDEPVEGEKAWIARWSQFGAIAKPSQYRVFSHYIGPNIDIVPEDICHDFIEPVLNPFAFTGYYADKNVFDKLFPDGYFPKTVLRKMNGFYYDSDYQLLSLNDGKLQTMLGILEYDKLILKPSVDVMSGVGVQMIVRKKDRGGYYNNESDKLTYDYIQNRCGHDIIIQEAVEQSEYINQFNPTSVNTLRLSLYRSVIDDKCHITGAIMRIGGKGSVVDNAHAGGCYVGINQDGTFCHEVLDQYGRKRTVFNGVDFSVDFKYPNWEKVLDFGKSIGKYVPHHRLLALDIVLDKDSNPHLIEFNCMYYSSWLFQYTTGPAFGPFTQEILEYCKDNSAYNYAYLKI